MCLNESLTPKESGVKPLMDEMGGVASAIQYTLPVYRETKDCNYIEFYAFDPSIGRLRRKRIKTNRIKGVVKCRQYARNLIKRITEQLNRGWNPWIVKDTSDLHVFSEILDRFYTNIGKMLESGYYRKETYNGYKSYLKILREYSTKVKPIYYAYQFDRMYCVEFLDYVFIKRDNGAQTRNNYLHFLRLFSSYMLDKGYVKTRPSDGIAPISKRLYKKERTAIPLDTVAKINGYCIVHDRHFLLACYLLYYCFIRPVEMVRLRIGDFNIKAGTITIPAECSKNKKKQTVTVPKKVMKYALELGIFSAPVQDFIFSDGLTPGSNEINPKIFRDHWGKLRNVLGFRKEWKFYSLKDTGITEMLKSKNVQTIEVRDQARHSSLSITDIYTDHSDEMNPEIYNIDGAL
ncbi:MAG: tyrosine-type recombinase/integrase [Muribaculaceae bacterium]|nr:tyrosine-type recombinase/integrase [Muribaculaceae bacterium]